MLQQIENGEILQTDACVKLYSGTLTDKRTWATQDDPRPALPLSFGRTSVVHQCRVETSVHHSSSDQRCEDYQGSFQIICGAMNEENFPSPANCQKSSQVQPGAQK